MSLALMLLLQAASAPPAPDSNAAAGVIPVDFDLKAWAPPDPCARDTDSADIVVCGRRREDVYRVQPLPRGFGSDPLVAEVGLGGGATGRAYLETVEMPPGSGKFSKRVMVGIKVPF